MATQIFIVSGVSQTSPADWTNASNSVEALGGGGSGAAGRNSGGAFSGRVAGGGGSEYRKISNFTVVVPGTTSFVYTIGPGGTGVTQSADGQTAGNAGTQTTFNVTDLVAKPGLGGDAAAAGGTCNGGAGGTGGTGAAANFDGGRGGNVTNNGASTGGGGAGGSTGAGNQGVDSTATNQGFDGGSGDAGSGGAAGTGGGSSGNGGNGGNGAEWDASHGSGGGGGGGRRTAGTGLGGTGGNYGGGGGAVTQVNSSGTPTSGAGGPGIIVLTYPIASATNAGWMGQSAELRRRTNVFERDLDIDVDPPSPATINLAPQVFSEVRRRSQWAMSPAWFFQPMGNVPTAATPQGWKGEWADQRRRPLVKDLAEASDASPPLVQRRGWEIPPISIRQRPLVRDLAEASDAASPALQSRAPDDRWSATPWPRAKVASGYEQSLFAITVVVTAYSWGEQPQNPITIRPVVRGPFAADVRLGTDAAPTGFVGAFPDLFIRSKRSFMADGWQPMGNVPTADTPQGWWPQGWKETRVPRWIQPTQLEWFYEASAATVITYPEGWRFDATALPTTRLRIGPSATVGKAADATFMAWVGHDASRVLPRRAASAPVEPFPPTVPQGWGAWSDGSRVMIRRWAGFDAFGQPAAPTIWGWSGEFPSILIRRPRVAPQQETPRARVETVWVASFHDVKLIARTLSAQYPIDTIVAARAATLGWDWTESRVRRARKPMAEPMGTDTKSQPFAQGPMGWWTEYKWTFKHPNSQPIVNEEMWLRTGFPFFYRPTLIGIDKNAALQGADTNTSLDGKKETPEVDGSLGDV